MKKLETFLNQNLADLNLISPETHNEIKEYQAKNIFSLHNELLTLLYISIILFTSGIGVLIYKNIDTIGHIAILAINFVLMIACFYVANKKFKGWYKTEVLFENSLYDYVVLLGSILATIFVGYLQFQYKIFGNYTELVSLFCAIMCFAIAYFFDNKTVLSIAITALTTYFGVSLSLSYTSIDLMFGNNTLIFTALFLGIAYMVWRWYFVKINLKAHFQFIFLTFAFHLIGLSCMTGLANNYWFLYVLITPAFIFYFYKISKQTFEISIYVFTLIYAFIGLNVFFVKILSLINFNDFIEVLFIFSPFFYIGSIVLFIYLIIQFKKEKNASLL